MKWREVVVIGRIYALAIQKCRLALNLLKLPGMLSQGMVRGLDVIVARSHLRLIILIAVAVIYTVARVTLGRLVMLAVILMVLRKCQLMQRVCQRKRVS